MLTYDNRRLNRLAAPWYAQKTRDGYLLTLGAASVRLSDYQVGLLLAAGCSGVTARGELKVKLGAAL